MDLDGFTTRLFYTQAIGNRLFEILTEEGNDKFSVIHQVKDESKKRELKMEDEEEDFLDEGTNKNNTTQARTRPQLLLK